MTKLAKEKPHNLARVLVKVAHSATWEPAVAHVKDTRDPFGSGTIQVRWRFKRHGWLDAHPEDEWREDDEAKTL